MCKYRKGCIIALTFMRDCNLSIRKNVCTDHWPFDCPYSMNLSILGITQKSMFDVRAANPVMFSKTMRMFETILFNMEATCSHLAIKIWFGH